MEEGSDPFSVEAAVMVDPAARGASDEADSAHDADSSAEALDYSGAAAEAVPVAHPAAPIPREEDKLDATDAPSAAVEDNGVSTAEFLPPGGVGAVDELRDEVILDDSSCLACIRFSRSPQPRGKSTLGVAGLHTVRVFIDRPFTR
jgi:hypothetical protein